MEGNHLLCGLDWACGKSVILREKWESVTNDQNTGRGLKTPVSGDALALLYPSTTQPLLPWSPLSSELKKIRCSAVLRARIALRHRNILRTRIVCTSSLATCVLLTHIGGQNWRDRGRLIEVS